MRWIAAASLALACCAAGDVAPPPRAQAAGATAPRPGGILRLALNDDVARTDPALSFDELSNFIVHHTHETLLGYEPALAADPTRLRPALAESYESSPDGLVWRFTLRPGLVYADGTPLVAGDFVHALERVLDPDLGSPAAGFYSTIRGARARLERRADHVEGLRAPDERHLEITLEEPDAFLPLMMAMLPSAPVPPGRDADPPASGPFVIREWRRGERMELARNPRFVDAAGVYLDGIEVILRVPRDVAILKLLAGELDMATRLSSDDYLRFAASPAWAPYLRRSTQLVTIGELLDTRRPPFDDKRVRQALNYALSKDDVVRLYNGRAVPSHGMIPPPLLGYDPALAPYPHDPARARRLLAEAGLAGGFDITYTTLNEEYARLVAQSVQADLAAVGVRMRIEILSFPAYLDAVGGGRVRMGLSAWSADFPDAWSMLFSRFHSANVAPPNATNDTGYTNPELDALLDRARRQPDPDARARLYRRADAILHEDCPMIWSYHQVEVEVLQPYVRDYAPHPVWLRDVRGVWLDR